eukprot:scpid46086/ scgid15345/ Aflatoxin B1 aldehyde reductase member 2; Succinic semialdehyde reductase
MAVRTILGTMEFGRRATMAESLEMTQFFVNAGHKELDTAYMYSGGKSEEFIGDMPVSHDPNKVSVATKVNPWGPEGLTAEGVKKQFTTCLERLRADSVDILYLHAPDHKTPIEDTLAVVQEFYKAGKFKELALSNYAAWQVVEIYYICKANGYVLPTLYQGMYNAFTRDIEKELLPALRRLGIRFYAYNPLAGGLMTGKYKYEDEDIPNSRFFGNSWSQTYRNRFWKKVYFDALDCIRDAMATAGNDASLTEVSLRWMYHHSQLAAANNDGVILGASNMGHLTQNMAATEKGPLEPAVVEAFEKAWKMTAPGCEQYFR